MNKFIPIALLFLIACTTNNNDTPTTESEVEIIEAPIQVDDHNSQNSLDWAGTYFGTLPCADCEGIEWTLTLNENSTYTLKENYLGKEKNELNSDGKFTWDDDGNFIMILREHNTLTFKVGENHILVLDERGFEITGELAEFYILRKK